MTAEIQVNSVKRRRFRWRWLLIGILPALAALVGGAELFLRLAQDFGLSDPEERARYYESLKVERTIVRNRGGLQGHFAGVDVRINQQGFRGPKTHTSKPPGVYRILLLGDEKTFGWGVPEEKTYAALMQKTLDEVFIGSFEVLNAGVPGYHLTMIGAYVQQTALLYKPDVICLLLDGADIVGDEQAAGNYDLFREGPAKYSYLARLFILSSFERLRIPLNPRLAGSAARVFNNLERRMFRQRIDLFVFFWATQDDPLRVPAKASLPEPRTWVWARPVDTGVVLARLPRSMWRTGALGNYPSEQAHQLLALQHVAELTTRAISFFFMRRDGKPTPRNQPAAPGEVN